VHLVGKFDDATRCGWTGYSMRTSFVVILILDWD